MGSSLNKYDLTNDIRKHSSDTAIVLNKLFDVFWKQGETEKEIKECRDKLIETMFNDEVSTKEIEEWFLKIDPIIYELSPNTFEIQASFDAFENIRENYDRNIKMPWIWKKILKFLFWLQRKAKKSKENRINKLWIKWFWTYVENANEDWLDTIDTNYSQSFINLYKKNIMDYLIRNNDIPTMKEMLKRTFCMAIKNNIVVQLQKNEFSENDCKESFWVLSDYLLEKWISLEPSDNIKASFIEECKKHYPLAKNSCNHLFENKSFKTEFINKISDEIEDEIEQVFEFIYRDVAAFLKIRHKEWLLKKEDMEKNFITLTLVLSNILWKYQEFKDISTRKSDMLSLYFLAIADKFEEDHLKKLKKSEKTSETKKAKIEEKEDNEEEISIHKFFNAEKKTTIVEKDTLERFDKVVGIIGWDEDKKESMKRYLLNLFKKELPINFAHFKQIFNIQEIPPKAEHILLDKIGMEFEAEEEIKEKNNKWEITTKTEVIENTIETEIEDPITYMTDCLKKLWYQYINETNFIEQVQEYCKDDSQNTILKNLLKNPKFWKVLLHKSGCKKARVLPIGKTWWRVLMVKIDDTIYIDWYYKHKDYEQRLDLIKKWKIKTLIS